MFCITMEIFSIFELGRYRYENLGWVPYGGDEGGKILGFVSGVPSLKNDNRVR